MKIFCAYAFTGEDLNYITNLMATVVNTLEFSGNSVYCNRFDSEVDEMYERGDIASIFNKAFKVIEESDAVVAIVTSDYKSIGQIIEIGASLSRHKKLYIFEKKSVTVSNYLKDLVNGYYRWENEEELKRLLKELF